MEEEIAESALCTIYYFPLWWHLQNSVSFYWQICKLPLVRGQKDTGLCCKVSK